MGDELDDMFEAMKKDIDSEPFNSGELERKAQEQAKNTDKDDKGKKGK